MKSCPKCSLTYQDDLEFCLEDGTRLVSGTAFGTEIPTITRSNNPLPTTAKTVSLPFPTQSAMPDVNRPKEPQTVPQTTLIKEKAIEQSNKILEVFPIVTALAHNWWQWIYLNNQPYSSFTAYFFSPVFLVWLLLLIITAALGVVGFKRVRNKGFAVAGLVILAINFILFLVPKR